jgi:glyoxylase-like metal-dependent hydrolase (beta-lactamase superfamily II)
LLIASSAMVRNVSTEVLVIPIGPLRTNVALLGDSARREAVVIDPAIPSLERLTRELATRGWRLVLALSTHGHWDHTGELAALSAHIHATENRVLPIAVHAFDRHRLETPQPLAAPFPIPAIVPTRELADGDRITAGAIDLQVLHTPGHTEGSISLLDATAGVLYSGDTLFRGAWGRTDLPGGDASAMLASLERLAAIDERTRVIPGHGRETTIGAERAWIASAVAARSLDARASR